MLPRQALGQVGADNGVRDGEILISGHLCMLRQAAPMLSEEDLLRLRLASTQTPHFVHLNSAELTYSQDKGVLIKIEDIKVEEIIGVVSHDPNVKPFQKELSVSRGHGREQQELKDGKETEAEGRNAAAPASNAIFWRGRIWPSRCASFSSFL